VLETESRQSAFKCCFRMQLAPVHLGWEGRAEDIEFTVRVVQVGSIKTVFRAPIITELEATMCDLYKPALEDSHFRTCQLKKS
jgi:hypothetical protein